MYRSMQHARDASAQEQERLNTIATKNAKLVKVSIYTYIYMHLYVYACVYE